MANNGLNLTIGNCDLELYAMGDTYGFQLTTGSTITEQRGSQFVGSVGTGAPTYQEAEPFTRTQWETFNGGFGQILQNKQFGGTGQGGDPAKYLYGDCWTLKGNVMLPGMARRQAKPLNLESPLSDELELPRGVMPTSHPAGVYNKFTLTSSATFRKIRLLVKFYQPSSSTVTITAIVNGQSFAGTFSNVQNYVGFKWLLLDHGSAITLTAGTYVITAAAQAGVIYGCFIGTNNSTADVIQPYWQLVRNGTDNPYTYWQYRVKKVEQLFWTLGVNYLPFAITTQSLFNPSDRTIAERVFTYPVTGSLVFDNLLYIGQSDGSANDATKRWTSNDAYLLIDPLPADSTTVIAIGPSCVHEGLIYTIDGRTMRKIYKWTGKIPATGADAPTLIIDTDKIGKPSVNGLNNLNNIIMHRGLLYLFKPEGVFMVYVDPSKITTAAVPRMVQIVNLGDTTEHRDNGKYVVEHQNALYFNVRDQVWQLNISDNGNEISVLLPPWPLGRARSYNYVNGIASDGQMLYMSYNNLGVAAFTGAGYHLVTEFYEQINEEGIASGLRFAMNPQVQPDYLFIGENKTLVQIPIPNYHASYSDQINLDNQNKCFYWISSVWDADLAEIVKLFHSISLRAFPSGFKYKIVGALWQTGTPNFRTIVEKTLNEGLHRDRWISPQSPNAGLTPTVTLKILDGSGNATTVDAPATWIATDFENAFVSSEKTVTDTDVDKPIKSVSMAFILYGWNPAGSGYYPNTTLYTDISYIESLVLKYLPILDYVPIYKVSLDIDALISEDHAVLTQAKLYETLAWLRSRMGARSPTQFRFKDIQGATKTVIGFIQNPVMETDPNLTADGDPLPKRIFFNILSLTAEYTGV